MELSIGSQRSLPGQVQEGKAIFQMEEHLGLLAQTGSTMEEQVVVSRVLT